MRVVLVEDHLAFAQQCQHLLMAVPGVRMVKLIAAAQEACDWLRDNETGWDLVVADLFLGSGHGFKVLHACHGRQHGQRIVVLTGYADPAARQYAMLAGADRFFSKATDLPALVSYCSALADDVREGGDGLPAAAGGHRDSAVKS